MKKFSQIISEVAEPRSGDEQRFKAAHVVTKIGHPVALDHQFTGEVKGIGSSARIADRKKGEDEAAYDPSYIEKDKQFKMPRNVDEATDPVNKDELKGKHKDRKDQDIDNDGDVDSSDEYLHKRRQAVSKAISKSLSKKTEASVEESAELEGLEEELSATCGCGSDCNHCGGKHDMDEVDSKCSCCDNMIKPSAANESVELDEILDTPKAMQSYDAKNKASFDRAASSAAAKILRGKDKDGNRADHRPELKTMDKRKKGQTMRDMLAVRRTFANLRNEEVELVNEASYMKGHIMDRADAHHDQARYHQDEAAAAKKGGDNADAMRHREAFQAHTKAANYLEKHHEKRERGQSTIINNVHSQNAHAATQRAPAYTNESVEQIDEISRSMTPMRNRFGGTVDPKKFDTYKKHMKTHKLDEPTVRMIHQNPDDAESKRMMKNPKYAQAVSLYKNSMKEEVELDEDRRAELHHQSMMFTHAMKQAELKKKDPRLAKQHDMAGKLHAKAADLHVDNHPDAKKHSDKANRASKLLGEEVDLDEAKTDIYHKHMLKALGKSRLPKNHSYTSMIANNGDFVVKDGGGRTVGRIAKGDHNLKEAASKLLGEEVELSENPMEEKPMMMNALRSMSHNIMGIARYVQSTQDPEEWFQNKLAGVAKEMQTLYSYATAEVMAMGEEVELDESQKAALAKELSKASAASEKGKKAVTLKKAPWDEQVDETTLSAIKRPVNVTGPDGKTRTVYKTTKTKKYDDKGQDIIKTNESNEILDEAFKPGIIKFKNNQSMILSKEDSDILNKMLKKLTSTNRKKMETIAMKDKKGFAEILEFAKEAM